MFAREKMIDEMMVQIRAVFGYYTDQKLTETDLCEVRISLEKAVPRQYTSDNWEQIDSQYKAKLEQET